MLNYDFEILHKPRCENKTVDALSRNPMFLGELQKLLVANLTGREELQKEFTKDEKLQKLVQELKENLMTHNHYMLRGDKLFYKDILAIPKGSKFLPSLLKEFHSSPNRGYLGYLRTYHRIIAVLFWQGMKSDIKQFVVECDIC